MVNKSGFITLKYDRVGKPFMADKEEYQVPDDIHELTGAQYREETPITTDAFRSRPDNTHVI